MDENEKRIKELEKQIETWKKVDIIQCQFCGHSNEIQKVEDLILEKEVRKQVLIPGGSRK